jgi:hypothetical protein
MRNQYYILNAADEPVPVDLLTWAQWLEDRQHRQVALDTFPAGRLVSTLFLGLDHNVGDGPPLLFETIVFVDGDPVDIQRYATRVAALAGHARAVADAGRAAYCDVSGIRLDPPRRPR